MKRNRLILATIPLVVLGILALVKLFPRTVPLDECSPLYRQYAGHEDIEATFVKDYPVDDTTLVDVTFLRATTDSAWVSLCMESLPYGYPDNLKENIILGNAVTQYISSKDDIRTKVIPTDTNSYNLVWLTAIQKSIIIFHTENLTQTSTILDKGVFYLFQNNCQNPLP